MAHCHPTDLSSGTHSLYDSAKHLTRPTISRFPIVHNRVATRLDVLRFVFGLQVARVFHGAVAAHLPLAVYYFASHLLSRDAAVLSAILTASSIPLAVLGTHPLVNSFLGPVVFACIGLIARLFATSRSQTSREDTRLLNIPDGNCTNQRCMPTTESTWTGAATTDVMQKTHSQSIDGMVYSYKNQTDGTAAKRDNTDSSHFIQQLEACVASNIANPMDDTKSVLPLLNKNGKIVTSKLSGDRQIVSSCGDMKLFICGVLLGLACYIRIDLILFVALTIALVLFCWRTNKLVQCTDTMQMAGNTLRSLIGGFAVSLVLGGFDDYVTYGTWFMSPYRWFAFNIRNETANILFGCKTFFFYFQVIIVDDPLAIFLFLSVVMCMVLMAAGRIHCATRDRNTGVSLNSVCVVLFILYSIKGHKELRFVHNALALYALCCANTIVLFYRSCCHSVPRGKPYFKAGVYAIVFVVGLNCIARFPRPSNGTSRHWSYLNVPDSNHVNDCLDFVGRQEGATGIFLDRSIHVTAGYSVLHKNIPVFTLIHYEFVEFDKGARKILYPNRLIFDGQAHSVNVSVIGRISEFISVKNSPLLLKRLINNPEYNYLIVKSDRRLVSFGYRQVYTSGTMRVVKRTDDKDENEALQKLAASIPIGSNGSTLEYEGSWLYSFGLDRKAVERLEAALVLNPFLVRAYQLLALANIRLGRHEDAHSATQRCSRVHGAKTCRSPQHKVVLHSDYDIKVDV